MARKTTAPPALSALLSAIAIALRTLAACSSSEPQTGPACALQSAPNCRAGGAPVCGADWQEAKSLFPACWSPSGAAAYSSSFLANCGPYRAVAVHGKDGYEAYFYDASGKLVGHGVSTVGHVTCAAYDASFAFPSEDCTPIDGECSADASTSP